LAHSCDAHRDIDTEDPSAPLDCLGSIAPSEFGPGAVIVTLNLGSPCHVLLKVRIRLLLTCTCERA
jgi:hypothetical protein